MQVVEGVYLLNEYIDEAVKTGDWNEVRRLTNTVVNKVHNAAQAIGILAQYGKTAAGSVMKSESIAKHDTDSFVKRANKTQNGRAKIEKNSKLAGALADLGNDSLKAKSLVEKVPKTHEQIRQEVVNTLSEEMGSIDNFTEKQIDALTALVESKDVSRETLTTELERFFKDGQFFTIDESLTNNQRKSQKVINALNTINGEVKEAVEKPAVRDFNEVRNEVKAAIESSSVGDFSESEIDMLANMIQKGYTTKEIAEALNRKLATGNLGVSDEDIQAVNELFKDAENEHLTSKEKVEKYNQAYAILAKYCGNATFIEKWNAWRYLAMLGNLKNYDT